MNTQIAPKISVNSSLFFEDMEAPVDAWSLDELGQFSDLESVRSAWAHTDYPDD